MASLIFLSYIFLFGGRNNVDGASVINDRSADDVVEARKVAFEIGVAFFEDRTLLTGPDAAAGRFSILGVELVHHIHTFNDLAERRKRLFVVRRRIVPQIDENLRRSAVRHGEGISDRPAHVRFAARIVRDRLSAPDIRDLRVAVDAELRPFAFDDAMETHIVVIARADEVVKSINSNWRPIAMNLNQDDSFARFEPRVETIRRAAVHLWSIGLEQ